MDIHAPFYPMRGCYSSSSTATLVQQFTEMKTAGIDVAVVSWWGRPNQQGTQMHAEPRYHTVSRNYP